MTTTHTYTETDHAPADGDTGTKPRSPAVEHLLQLLKQQPRTAVSIGLLGRWFITLGQTMALEAEDDPELAVALRHLIDARTAYMRAFEATRPELSSRDFGFHSGPFGRIETFDFGHAVAELRAGNRVSRLSWGPSGAPYLLLVPGSTIEVAADRPLGKAAPELVGETVSYGSHIDLKPARGPISPWQPDQTAVLADDWFVYANGN